jgi:hypothetical protein
MRTKATYRNNLCCFSCVRAASGNPIYRQDSVNCSIERGRCAQQVASRRCHGKPVSESHR